MIHISCKFHLQKNDVIYSISLGHNQTPKVASNMQRTACSSSFIPCKNKRKLVTSGVIFTVNPVQDGPFRGCSWMGGGKKAPSLKSVTHLSRYTEQNIKSEKANRFLRKLSDQHEVKFKNYVYLSKKEACNNK